MPAGHHVVNNYVKPRLHDTTRCQTGLATGCSIVQPVEQPAASCKRTLSLSTKRSTNHIAVQHSENRLNLFRVREC